MLIALILIVGYFLRDESLEREMLQTVRLMDSHNDIKQTHRYDSAGPNWMPRKTHTVENPFVMPVYKVNSFRGGVR